MASVPGAGICRLADGNFHDACHGNRRTPLGALPLPELEDLAVSQTRSTDLSRAKRSLTRGRLRVSKTSFHVKI